jgi:Leucine-rich repeat (LRR) protein
MFLPSERMFTCSVGCCSQSCWRSQCTRRYVRCQKKKKNKAKKKGKKKKMTIKKKAKALGLWIQSHVMSSTGEYFIVFLWMKEMLQSLQQLVGVSNSAKETEAFNAVGTVILVACSLILLPTSYHIVLRCSGPTLAVAVNLFLKSFIGRFYILVSVFVRRTETTVGGRDFGEALLRHSLTLLPAFLFIKSKDTFYILHKTYQFHSAAQLAKSAQSETVNPMATPRINEQKVKLAHRRTESSRSRRSSLAMEMRSHRHVVTNMLGVVGVLTGMALGLFSILRFVAIQRDCRDMMGIIADCASPKYYFQSGYFFGKPSCAVEHYEKFACANGTLGKAEHLLNNASIYAKMVRLQVIDVSSNSYLSSLPESWSAVPHTIVVLAARNSKLTQVPYSLCNDTANITLDAEKTPFAKHVGWSGQLNRAQTSTRISPSCLQSIHGAQILDISNNDLNCGTYACDFQEVVMKLRNLSYVDFSNNLIQTIDAPLITMTKHFYKTTESSFNMTGNPVVNISISAEPFSVLKSWCNIIDESDLIEFKEFTFNIIDFQENSFIDMGLKKLEWIRELRLLHAQNINWAISKHLEFIPKRLTRLYLKKFLLTTDGAKALAVALPNSAVKELLLEEMGMSDEEGVLIISNLPPGLLQLSLAYNVFNSAGTITVDTPVHLRLGDKTAKELATLLPSSLISYLDLSHNFILSNGTKALAVTLPVSQITHLDLYANGLGETGIIALANALPRSQVIDLNLGHTEGHYMSRHGNFSMQGTKTLVAKLNQSKVKILAYHRNELGDEGATIWASALPKLNLISLRLSENKINDNGANALAAALPTSSLQHLDLSTNNINDAGVKALVDSLLQSRIVLLNLFKNSITLGGWTLLREVNGKKNIHGETVIIMGESLGYCYEVFFKKCREMVRSVQRSTEDFCELCELLTAC